MNLAIRHSHFQFESIGAFDLIHADVFDLVAFLFIVHQRPVESEESIIDFNSASPCLDEFCQGQKNL